MIGCKGCIASSLTLTARWTGTKNELVAKWFHQSFRLNHFDTLSPVVKPVTVIVVLSLAVTFNRKLRKIDVNNAFLNGELFEIVYMIQPPEFESSFSRHHVCLLRKALYSLN